MDASTSGAPSFERLAAAFVRGAEDGPALRPQLRDTRLDALTGEELAEIIEQGRAYGLKLHRFKRTMGLARVTRVLGILRGLEPESLLDIGSGRGAFLWPLLDGMPGLPVTAIDTLPHRVADMQAVARGGVSELTAMQCDVARLPFPPAAFDGTTMLEVLEHLEAPDIALRELFRVSRRFAVLSVPSTPDDNPEHLRLYGETELHDLLRRAGARRVRFDAVLNHRIAVATL